MKCTLKILLGFATAAVMAAPAPAQESASFKLNESSMNLGGNPNGAANPASTSYRISLDALGSVVGSRTLSSATFRMDPGFVTGYRPPGEVASLVFSDVDTLAWDADPAAVSYSVYRDLLSALDALGYGNCLAGDVSATTLDDIDVPPVSDGYFYLITALNRIDEEGTKGADASGSGRPNSSPCP